MNTRRIATPLVALLAAAVPLACDAPTEVAESGGVRAAADAEAIRVTNGTGRPVFTFVVGSAYAARILWGPCVDVAGCPPPIAPGATLRRARADVPADPGEREALVYWWHAGPRVNGVVQAESVRSLLVRLP